MEFILQDMTAKTQTCPNAECDATVRWSQEHCPKCNATLSPPNIREALQEQAALEDRYQEARATAQANGAAGVLTLFEQRLRWQSKAVINLPVEILRDFVAKDRPVQNYHLLCDNGGRYPADATDEKRRLGVEGTLFGGYMRKINYAALSLTHQGLFSYG